MQTSKSISTITYNTIPFLQKILDRFLYLHIISYYEFIKHLPDVDGKKEHIHLYIVPNKKIDTENFREQFVEPDLLNPDKPLKPQPFVFSKYGDWYWYVLHNEAYLKSKMQERNLHYEDNHIISSDIDVHERLVLENPLCNFTCMNDNVTRDYVCQCVYNGVSIHQMLSSGHIALGKTQSAIALYNVLLNGVVQDNIGLFNKNNIVKSYEQDCLFDLKEKIQ